MLASFTTMLRLQTAIALSCFHLSFLFYPYGWIINYVFRSLGFFKSCNRYLVIHIIIIAFFNNVVICRTTLYNITNYWSQYWWTSIFWHCWKTLCDSSTSWLFSKLQQLHAFTKTVTINQNQYTLRLLIYYLL